MGVGWGGGWGGELDERQAGKLKWSESECLLLDFIDSLDWFHAAIGRTAK